MGCEILDKGNREYRFFLLDRSGALKRERRVPAGQGPNEIQGGNLETVWINSSGTISCLDIGDYLKTIDPETLEIQTVVKLANVIKGYGSRFVAGRIAGSVIEERNGRIVTTFESTGFPSDFVYHLATCTSAFEDLSVLAAERKRKPPSWERREIGKLRGGRMENLVDYYERLRLTRDLAVDWKRGAAYLIPDIEQPVLIEIDLATGKKDRYSIDIDSREFAIERQEFEAFFEYAASETPEILKQAYRTILDIPDHAPALMRAMVVEDFLLLVTGNRNWRTGENETLVYRLPSLTFEGSFDLPFSNCQNTKWSDPYYVTVDRVAVEDDYVWRYAIYELSEIAAEKKIP